MREIRKIWWYLPVMLLLVGMVGSVWGEGPSEEELRKMQEAAPAKATVKPVKARKLLVINLCKGFRHSSIPYWDKAIEIMGKKTGAYTTVISGDLNMLKPENIHQFDAICLNNTTRLGLSPDKTPELCKGLTDFLASGKGLIGIHFRQYF